MQLITHQSHLNALPESPIKDHITARFGQLSQDTDVPPNIILVENGDDITGPDYAFVGEKGLLSDLWGEHEPGHPKFSSMFEWVSRLPDLKGFEMLVILSGEDGFLIFAPESTTSNYPDFHRMLSSELSPPQPL